MKICLYLLCALGLASFLAAQPLLELRSSIKEVDEFDWPPKFRIAEFPEYSLLASASGQFSKKGFEFLSQELSGKNLVLIDLRREFHGLANGYPISWKLAMPGESPYGYNEGLTADQIEAGEAEILNRSGFEIVQTERDLVGRSGVRYVRFPISDHSFPQGEEVDRFIELAHSIGKDSWIHFHCAGGGGRTTVFLSMLDMMQNSQFLSADEILKRQEAIGGTNLYDPAAQYADEPGRIDGAAKRVEFLLSFHRYCLENPMFSQSWSSWKSGEISTMFQKI